MIIQCPRCSTRWRVGDPSATENPVFKCGRCHHVFPQFPGAPPAAERNGSAKAREAPPEPDNLEFIFPRRRAMAAGDAAAAHDAIAPLREIVHDPPRAALATSVPLAVSPFDTPAMPAAPPARMPATLMDGLPASVAEDQTDAFAEDPTDALCEAPIATTATVAPVVVAPAASPSEDRRPSHVVEDSPEDDEDADEASGPVTMDAADTEPSFDLGRDDAGDDDGALPDLPLTADDRSPAPRVLDMEAMMRASARTAAFRPATRLLLALVAGFALLALFLRANPARSEGWLGRIPLVGTKLAAEPALGARITLTDVQGGYQRLRTGRRIFVISGKATNNALVAVERIEVEGALYAASGNVDRKVISTGNKTTLKLRDLSESEITLLQKLDARQPVGPGGSVDFAVVFLEPPRDLREFSSRVLTARSTARASAPADPPRNPASVG